MNGKSQGDSAPRSSIFFDRNKQVMRCFGCTKTHPVMAKTVRDPDAMLALKEQLAHEHSGCMPVPIKNPILKTAMEFMQPLLTLPVSGPMNCC